jgi:hypothetical protein
LITASRPLGLIATTLFIAALAVVGSGPSQAARLTYPGSPGCNRSLQRCIDNAPRGSTILIDRNRRIQQNIEIKKSLTLKPAPGKEPTIAPPNDFNGFTVVDRQLHPVRVRILDLRVKGAVVSADLESDNSHFLIRGTEIVHRIPSNGTAAVDVSLNGGSEAVAQHNILRSTGAGIEFFADPGGEVARFTALGNLITTTDPEDSNSGIELDLEGTGNFLANLHSNVIYRMAGCFCGGASGMDIGSGESVEAMVNIVNNTLDDIQGPAEGIDIDEPEDASSLLVQVYNNSVSRATEQGISIGGPPSQSFLVEHNFNNYYDNAYPNNFDGHTGGANDTSNPPDFVDPDAGNYRLSNTSSLKDAGLVCSPGGLMRKDAAGRLRFHVLAGDSVDMGAYERATPSQRSGRMLFAKTPDGDVNGTRGHDVICGKSGDNTLKGGRGNDWVDGRDGADNLRAGPGGDRLLGREGADDLFAVDNVSGNDLLEGGDDVDTCTADPGDSLVGCP